MADHASDDIVYLEALCSKHPDMRLSNAMARLRQKRKLRELTKTKRTEKVARHAWFEKFRKVMG